MVENLLNLPEVQSGVIPFFSSIIIALLLRPLKWYWSAIALSCAFFLSAYAMGLLQFVPLRSTSKVLLLGLAALVIGMIADYFVGKRYKISAALFVLAGCAGLWLIWPVLSRQQGNAFWLMAVASFLYIAWLGLSSEALRNHVLRAASAAWVLALSTALAVILGASASLGQLGIGLAAGAGAFCLLAVFMASLNAGSTFSVPALIIAGLIGLAGVVFAKTPWYSLLLLAAIPALARLPIPTAWPRFGQAVLLTVYTLPVGVAAVLLTWWQTASDAAYY